MTPGQQRSGVDLRSKPASERVDCRRLGDVSRLPSTTAGIAVPVCSRTESRAVARMFQDCLSGIRVLDFSHVLAGPYCAMTLADLGAEVSKVEPVGGERGRRIGPPWQAGESVIHLSVNRNKRSIAIDLKTDLGRRAVRRMV